MATKYLDSNGVLYFWNKIKSFFVSDVTFNSTSDKIQKVKNGTTSDIIGVATSTTSGLMSSEDKATLDGIISTGGEPNQNAFSNIKVNTTTVAADSTTDTLEFSAGSNITLTPDATNDKITIAATDTTYTNMTQTEATTGTATTARSISAKVLHDTISNAIATAITGVASFQGAINANTELSNLTSYSKGWYWVVATAGTYVNQTCEIGDMIFCIKDYDSSFKATDFTVIQNNLDISSITNAEIDAIIV